MNAGGTDDRTTVVYFGDMLRVVTRKERKILLATALLGILIVRGGLIPTEITNLGITFTAAELSTTLRVLGLVVLYFLAAFAIYAASDLLAWLHAFGELRGTPDAIEEQVGALERKLEGLQRQKGLWDSNVRHPLDDGIDATAEQLGSARAALQSARQRMGVGQRVAVGARLVLDFVVPVAVGGYAVFLLLTGLPDATFEDRRQEDGGVTPVGLVHRVPSNPLPPSGSPLPRTRPTESTSGSAKGE